MRLFAAQFGKGHQYNFFTEAIKIILHYYLKTKTNQYIIAS
jgi:hypothetical protein